VPYDYDSLIGRVWLRAFGIDFDKIINEIAPVNLVHSDVRLQSLLDTYKDVFSKDIGLSKITNAA